MNGHLNVTGQPIVFEHGNLVLGVPVCRIITRKVNGRGFVDRVSVGDWVSIHWNWACDVLTSRQLFHLQQYTEQSLALANMAL